MGRLLLLLITGAALGGYTLATASMDRRTADVGVQTSTQTRALARDAAEAAHAVVLGDLIDPATDRFRTSLTLSSFEAGGGQAVVEDYRVLDAGRRAQVTVAATVGRRAHRITSTYELRAADWPGPFVVESPYVVASTDPAARITSNGPDNGLERGVHIGMSRFDEYRLGSVLNANVLQSDVRTAMTTTGATPYFHFDADMAAVRGRFETPSLPELWDAALDAATVTEPGLRVTGTRAYGAYGHAAAPNAQVVHIDGDLEVPVGATLEGVGVLAVGGSVRVRGTLRWEGLVLIVPPRSTSQFVEVDLDGASVEVRGSVIVDQEAPPPGGHTDLTVFRALDGDWSHPAGDGGRRSAGRSGKPAAPATHSGPDNREYHYQHTHRIDQPHHLGSRRFVFDAKTNVQQGFTRFRETIQDLVARPAYSANTDVVLEFVNADAHGAARFDLYADGNRHSGSVVRGFGDFSGTADHTTQSFRLGDLDSLVVDVQSLRMLERLKNREVSDSPHCQAFWTTAPFSADCLIENRVMALSHLRDRDGALTIRLALADGTPLYEASLYWHTKSPGHVQHQQEIDADNAWRAAIRSGTANYGAELRLGRTTAVHLDLGHVQTAMQRLGLADLLLAHVGSRGESIEAGDVRP